jgi:hypothetical protein
MKYFLIKYRFQNGSQEAWNQDTWNQEIAAFIAAIDSDPELKGRVTYRGMRARDGADYYHLAGAVDEATVTALQSRQFFKDYTQKIRVAGGGAVDVVPLDVVAETAPIV